MIDPIKLLELQDLSWNSQEIADWFGVSAQVVKDQARRLGSPFPPSDGGRLRTRLCLGGCGNKTLYFQRVCNGCRKRQCRDELAHIEEHSLAGMWMEARYG